MAEPVKVGQRYRHSCMVGGKRLNDTFDTKKEARLWEADLRIAYRNSGKLPDSALPKHTVTEAFDLYNKTISTLKKNATIKESQQLNSFLPFFKDRFIEDITTADIARWRDTLLETVSASSVLRYRNLLSNVFTVARDEWKWIKESPTKGVRWPQEGDPRQSVWRWPQIKRMLREGQRRGGKYHEVTQAFHISLHTALRLKEALVAVCCFDATRKVIVIEDRKESHHLTKIDIPTVARARRCLAAMPKEFKVDANEASTLFSKLRSQLGITGLEYRDSRATALTLLARRMPVEVLQRISRHTDINVLIRSYYRATAEEISSRY